VAGMIEVKGVNDRLQVISILAKNGYMVRQKRIDQIVNGKKQTKSVIEYSEPEDPFISTSRRDDE
jgi:valyl-tRNA synthetase